MLSRRTRRGPLTGVFQMPVWTVLPCQVMSRGRPTLTESKRPITFPNDDHRKLEVNSGRLPATGSERSQWLRPSCEPLSGLHAASSYSNNCGHIADVRVPPSIRPSEEAGHINV